MHNSQALKLGHLKGMQPSFMLVIRHMFFFLQWDAKTSALKRAIMLFGTPQIRFGNVSSATPLKYNSFRLKGGKRSVGFSLFPVNLTQTANSDVNYSKCWHPSSWKKLSRPPNSGIVAENKAWWAKWAAFSQFQPTMSMVPELQRKEHLKASE